MVDYLKKDDIQWDVSKYEESIRGIFPSPYVIVICILEERVNSFFSLYFDI